MVKPEKVTKSNDEIRVRGPSELDKAIKKKYLRKVTTDYHSWLIPKQN